mgnify:CR=1 FL=1
MALECKDLGFYYERNAWIFQNLNITVREGTVFGIAGNSGCGKTSLSKVLANHLRPCAGEILIDGENTAQKERKGTCCFWPVQLIYQHPEKAVNPKWKIEKIIKESYEPSAELLERFGIRDEWLHRFPIELSGGELQRCLIVRALHPQVRYLIADEMTTMLDAVTQALIWKELLAVTKQRNCSSSAMNKALSKNSAPSICTCRITLHSFDLFAEADWRTDYALQFLSVFLLL